MKADALLIQAVAAMISVGFALPVHAMSEADVLRARYALDATPPAQRYRAVQKHFSSTLMADGPHTYGAAFARWGHPTGASA